VQLPDPVTTSAVSLERALLEQRSVRAPAPDRLEMAKISQLAWAAQGSRMPDATGTTPGSMPPNEPLPMRLYFVLPEGIYQYEPVGHALQPLSEGDVRQSLAEAVTNQPGIATFGGTQVIISASLRDFSARFGDRARAIMMMEAGRMSQSIQLQASALGLGYISLDDPDSAAIRRVIRVARNLDPLYIAFIGYPPGEAPQTATDPSTQVSAEGSVLIVLPPQAYQDQEYLLTRRDLERAGLQVTVASSRMGLLPGMLGGTVQPDLLVNRVNVSSYAGVVFIGGIGVQSYLNNPAVLNLASQANSAGKVVAAIGTAPGILAAAGVLQGVTATGYLTERDRIILGGAQYTGNPVEKDGRIVTATAAVTASTFARAILEAVGEQ
jgi:protease I